VQALDGQRLCLPDTEQPCELLTRSGKEGHGGLTPMVWYRISRDAPQGNAHPRVATRRPATGDRRPATEEQSCNHAVAGQPLLTVSTPR
jgi:hypothetical protein